MDWISQPGSVNCLGMDLLTVGNGFVNCWELLGMDLLTVGNGWDEFGLAATCFRHSERLGEGIALSAI